MQVHFINVNYTFIMLNYVVPLICCCERLTNEGKCGLHEEHEELITCIYEMKSHVLNVGRI